MREKLEGVAKDVRKPLTEWEEAEAEKERVIQEKLTDLQRLSTLTITEIYRLEDALNQANLAVIDDSWGKVQTQAELAKKNAVDHLTQRISDLKAQAKEREELEQFRKDKAEREEKERAEAEEKARQEREEQIAKEAAQKAEQDTKDAEERAQQAEERRIQAEKEAKEREERLQKEAAEREEKAKADAIEAEKQRVEAEKKAEEDAAAKREANKKHNAKINNEAKAALIIAGLSDQAATQAVTAIAKGMIPNITIRY